MYTCTGAGFGECLRRKYKRHTCSVAFAVTQLDLQLLSLICSYSARFAVTQLDLQLLSSICSYSARLQLLSSISSIVILSNFYQCLFFLLFVNVNIVNIW